MGSEYLDPAVPGADLERLLAAAEPIRKIVNSSIAHANASSTKFKGRLRPEELSAALDLIRDLFKKYSSHLANVDVAPSGSCPSHRGPPSFVRRGRRET